ncbi:hypothetical protein [Pararhizobium sp. A13]|uniref:hypothetical protein n=1 Tax=Pararhizobium sp. A13 TaxID=3133975 RepID=UPI00324A4179
MRIIAFALAALMMTAGVADAAFRSSGFRSSSFRSSSYTRSYSAPRPIYRAPATTYRNTTVHNTYVQQNSSGGGMFNSFIGSFGGIAAYNWLFGEDDKPAEQPATPAVAPEVK